MAELIPVRIVNALINSGVISADDKEIYIYGLTLGLLISINFVTTIVIGLAVGMVWHCLIFMLAYIPIRTYAGGYHAKTQFRCYLLSIATIFTVLLTIKLVPWTGFICGVIALIAVIVIVSLSPVEDKNKPLDQQEKVVYRKRTYIIEGILVVCAFTSWFLGWAFVSVSIIMALAVLAIMLVLGKLKNNLKEI